MATLYIDQKPFQVKDGQNILEACLGLGLNLPYFCWHPAMGSVGACRQCAVKQYKNATDSHGKIIMSCLTPVEEKTWISIEDSESKAFRASIIELLMTNHPHDCPVCDEGGECHLQDMTVMTGHNYRRFRFKKRTFKNQYLGPWVNHEMNRCIECYRCVRFYRDYAGGRDFNAFGIHHSVYFGREKDGVLENEFSGNLVEVCPTGVFTDKTFKNHYTRKWDLQTAASICVHCGVGCNTLLSERYGTVRRIQNRYHHQINGYFLCDRGRFGYEFINSRLRVREISSSLRDIPLPVRNLSQKNPVRKISKEEVLKQIQSILPQKPQFSSHVIGIGSPRASLESNYALRTLVGAENFFSGIPERESQILQTMISILKTGPARSASLIDIEKSDGVFVLGEDIPNQAPRLALTLRQTVRNATFELAKKFEIPVWHDFAVRNMGQNLKTPLWMATPYATRLDEVATLLFHSAPDEIARLGFAVAHFIHPSAPSVEGLSQDADRLAQSIAHSLKRAERPIIISGMSCQSHSLVQAAAQVAWALCRERKNCGIHWVLPECNSLGLGMIENRGLETAFQWVQSHPSSTVLILENDLFRRMGTEAVDAFLKAVQNVILLEQIQTPFSQRADILLPVSTYAEGSGTFVNEEGRAQRFDPVLSPPSPVQDSWQWIRDILLETQPDVISDLSFSFPAFKPVLDLALQPRVKRYWAPGWNSVQSLNRFQSEIGGELRGGPEGKRLFEPDPKAIPQFFSSIPSSFQTREGEWLIIPLYCIFGSEELSSFSSGMIERSPHPFIALHPQDAEKIHAQEKEEIELKIQNKIYHLPVQYDSSLCRGIAAVPVGLNQSGLIGIQFPQWGSLSHIPPAEIARIGA